MSARGYYRFPTIHGDTIAFISEDDIWTVNTSGGKARRLTAGVGETSHVQFSPDGQWLAFSGCEEGVREVYVMPATGGQARRLTYEGGDAWVVEWTLDGKGVVFASNAGQPFITATWLKQVSLEGGNPQRLPLGPARTVSHASSGAVALGRFQEDPARWKRYRGGRAGVIWVDPSGDHNFRPLIDLEGNLAAPRWVGDRVFFLSDHEGVGNLYSCLADGSDLQKHTDRDQYYVRHPSTDGQRIVYCAAGDLHVFDTTTGEDRLVDCETHSPRTQVARKFIDAQQNLGGYHLHPSKQQMLTTIRGRMYTMDTWEGPVVHLGQRDGVRYRLAHYLPRGEHVVCLSDAGGEEALEIHHLDSNEAPLRFDGLAIGRPIEMIPDPTGKRMAICNHRYEVVVVDLVEGTSEVVDTAPHGRIEGMAWSSDGRWLAFAAPVRRKGIALRVWNTDTRTVTSLTDGWYADMCPSFDPDGQYLYFLSRRDYDPVYDTQYFDLNFPQGMRPHLITLQTDTLSPFMGSPEEAPPAKKKNDDDGPPSTEIDLDGVTDRIIPFPVPEGIYDRIVGVKGEALFTSIPIAGSLGRNWRSAAPPPGKARLSAYKFSERRLYTMVRGVTDFQVDNKGKKLAYQSGSRLRVGQVGKSWENTGGGARGGGYGKPFGRHNGFVDLGRVKVSVEPRLEWRQMFREGWRLMRDHFWTDDMSGQDWTAIFKRYEPLLERIGSRAELSDLFWETQGSLGTSHAYEIGGDYRATPTYRIGSLAADTVWDPKAGGYRITHLVRGESGDLRRRSPLCAPGIGVKVGDVVLAVDATPLDLDNPIGALLAHRAGEEVVLKVQSGTAEPRRITVLTLGDERGARYREWVRRNREIVHEVSGGKLGYVHIPDMGPAGYAEFHRDYGNEADRDGLVVDVRYNRGGHVSQLLLEKIARRPLAYMKPRHGEPWSYPMDAVPGAKVAITNEFAGSDGDVFSHVFKMLGLGPLVGKRTWGGVIGIWPRHTLVDGTVTTQPEFSFWFTDVGWQVENYGTDPDVEVEYRPQDYIAGTDPQLQKAIALAMGELESQPVVPPDFSK